MMQHVRKAVYHDMLYRDDLDGAVSPSYKVHIHAKAAGPAHVPNDSAPPDRVPARFQRQRRNRRSGALLNTKSGL